MHAMTVPLSISPPSRAIIRQVLVGKPSGCGFRGALLGVGVIGEMWDVGKAALGHGVAGTPMQVLGLAGTAMETYNGVRSLCTSRSAQQINDALRGLNQGRDIRDTDAQQLADSVNRRLKVSGTLTLAASAACAVAITTGNMAGGLVAAGLWIADLAYSSHVYESTSQDIQQLLNRQ